MTEARVPVLLPHLELHAQLVREVEKMRDMIASGDADAARELMGAILPQLMANHIASADVVSAGFLHGGPGRPTDLPGRCEDPSGLIRKRRVR